MSINFLYYRCDALNLIMSKSQKKVIKKFNKYLIDGVLPVTNLKDESEGVNEDVVKDVEMNGIFTNKVVNVKPFEIPDMQTGNFILFFIVLPFIYSVIKYYYLST